MKIAFATVLAFLLHASACGQARESTGALSRVEQVIVFVVQKEVAASHIEDRKDVCVGFGNGLAVNEKAILSQLRNRGLKLHGQNWCNSAPRGMSIDVLSPVQVTPVGVYEVRVALGDLNPIRQEGAHFATLLRRGTYTVRYEEGYELQLERYQQDCCTGIVGEKKVSGFCDSLTTEAYHSPQCDWWVVHDPNRAEDVKIAHKPAYHTYSQWKLGDQTYILAYRDLELQPADMEADVYLANQSGNTLIGKIAVHDAVSNVSAVRLTGGEIPDLLFRTTCGELQCVFVLRFAKGKAWDVFSYGASEMEIVSEPGPRIVAKSRLANVVQEFTWDPHESEFRETRTYRWHKGE